MKSSSLCLHDLEVFGDFIVFRTDSEKIGGILNPRAAIDDFNVFIHNGGLLDLQFDGSKFFWCNGTEGAPCIWTRLQRTLASPGMVAANKFKVK